MRFLFVGGGTGGHLAPALGLAEALQERGHACLFLTSGRAVEREFLAGVDHRSLGLEEHSEKRRRRRPRSLALLPAMFRARRAAAAFRPDAVVGLGGLCGAAALGARRGHPLVLLEGNRVAGKAVRWMQRWAAATLTQFADTQDGLRRPLWVGPVSRRALRPLPKAAARARFGLPPDGVLLLLCGGSQGAEDLNRWTAGLVPGLARRGVALLALCGAGKGAELRDAVAAHGLAGAVLDRSPDMGAAYSAADFVLCRGGAATIAELWLHGVPAAVVPYPHHRDRQQEFNARALEPGVVVLPLLDAAAERELWSCLDGAGRRAAMAAALRAQAPADGLGRAVQLLEEIAGGKA